MIFPRVLRVLRVARGRAGDFVESGLRTGISDEFWLKRREPGGNDFLIFIDRFPLSQLFPLCYTGNTRVCVPCGERGAHLAGNARGRAMASARKRSCFPERFEKEG